MSLKFLTHRVPLFGDVPQSVTADHVVVGTDTIDDNHR